MKNNKIDINSRSLLFVKEKWKFSAFRLSKKSKKNIT